jgi:hypothetical protein
MQDIQTNDQKTPLKHLPIISVIIFLVSLFLLFFVFKRIVFVPKILMLLIIIFVALLLDRLKLFIREWFIFVSFIYLFDSLRGIVYILTCRLELPVYTTYVIKMEQFLFGGIPSVWIQNRLLPIDKFPTFSFLEKFITVLHGSHFVAFLLIGFIIWFYKSQYFKFFRTSFYFIIFLGISGYMIVPTVPPWMASELFNIIPRIIRFNRVLYNIAIPDISSGFDPNPIAAMPSLHAAFPILCSLIMIRVYRWKSLPFHFYTLFVFFSIVYTGDHYIVDILAGMLLAGVCYLLAMKLEKIPSEQQIEKESISKKEESSPKKLAIPLIIGGLILVLGIAVGNYNKREFKYNYLSYLIYVPKYVDLLSHEEDYEQNYSVQYYFASHHLVKGDLRKALLYFEHTLTLADNEKDRDKAQKGVDLCNKLLLKQNGQ